MKPMQNPTIPGYFSEAEEAARLGIGVATLRRWRRMKIGPASVRVGRRVLYPHDADEKWLAEQHVAAEGRRHSSSDRRARRPNNRNAV
jgi:hypothetical protein